jgi:integrase
MTVRESRRSRDRRTVAGGGRMPKLKFTKSALDKIPFPESGQVDYYDTETPGLGLRVGIRSKTFFVKTDVKDASSMKGFKTVRKSLGRFGEITLEQARREMRGYDDREAGFVPGKRLQLKRGELSDGGAKITLDGMINSYFDEKRDRDGRPLKASTVLSYAHILSYHFESWLPLPLVEVIKSLTPEVVIERYKLAERNHGPFGARNAFVMLSAVFNYARAKYPVSVPSNPLAVLRFGKHMRRIEAREDRLEGDDFRAFYEGIQAFNEVLRDCYLVCLYQGMRSEETAGLRWEYVDLEKRVIFIPDTKNRQALHVPLSRQSLAILMQRKERNPPGSPWVFPSLYRPQNLNKSGHVRLMAAELRARTGLKKITVHGLRRTFITTARKLKMFEDAERLTNHVDNSVTGRHYDGTGVEDLREPLQRICNEMERLMVEGVGAKVISISDARGK